MFKKLYNAVFLLALISNSFATQEAIEFKQDETTPSHYTVQRFALENSKTFKDTEKFKKCFKKCIERDIKQLNSLLEYIKVDSNFENLNNSIEGSKKYKKTEIEKSIKDQEDFLSGLLNGIDKISEASIESIKNDYLRQVCSYLYNQKFKIGNFDKIKVTESKASKYITIVNPYEAYLEEYNRQNGGKIYEITIKD